MEAERNHSDWGGQKGSVMAKATLLRAHAAVESHPRVGYVTCLYSVLEKAEA
jgi:hypothetical protein